MDLTDVEMIDAKKGKAISTERKIKGRGTREEGEHDDRYSGQGGVFESLEDDDNEAASSDPSGPLKCKKLNNYRFD